MFSSLRRSNPPGSLMTLKIDKVRSGLTFYLYLLFRYIRPIDVYTDNGMFSGMELCTCVGVSVLRNRISSCGVKRS